MRDAKEPRFVINTGNGDTPRWAAATVHLNDRPRGWVGKMVTLLRLLRGVDGAILLGCTSLRQGYFDIIAAAVVGRFGKPVVLAECTWEGKSRQFSRGASSAPYGMDEVPGDGWIVPLVVKALDTPRTYYCVLSEEERLDFPRRWGIPQHRVHNTRSLATVWSDAPYLGPGGGGVFAGGNSLRDYRALLEVGRRLPVPVTIATSLLPEQREVGLVVGPVPPDVYLRLAADATVVVVPIARSSRSAGQQTYLNAMLQGKPTVITDSVGVRDHVEPGEHALVIPENDPTALLEAVTWCLDHPDLAIEMGHRARAHVRRNYTRGAYYERILDVAEHAATRQRAG